ncbi:lycopene cyclase domain-containing protein [Daejeonella rubra]|uniref:Lycopene cyclase domain-containing protein n=1 Tax=Daejeonella rubra TaxID=990371 RepID=A0A1G9VQL5_9SPHI|nr:lycopene cyclase domain-containing protein [Daejeonella rubra]SDM74397.1 lycopene cyclase domain-containing protein [Daejeonella rubra]
MKFAYLLINFLTIFFPIILSFDKRVQFFKSWKFIFPGLFITGLLFLLWDYIFTVYGVWSFNPEYIIGFYILNLPLEEILFFVTVPFACIFVYECLNFYVRKDLLQRFSAYISYVLIGLSVLMLFLFYDRVYTLITFGLLAAVLIVAEFVIKSSILSRFYLAYLVSLLPFYIVNGILTSIPIVMYNDAENMAFRVGTIPLEDHFYSMSMLLINILLFEYFRKKGKLTA